MSGRKLLLGSVGCWLSAAGRCCALATGTRNGRPPQPLGEGQLARGLWQRMYLGLGLDLYLGLELATRLLRATRRQQLSKRQVGC